MLNEYYAIVVEVPQPENICFIAIPFREEFNEVSWAIEDAANRLGMQPFRTDKIARGPNFVQVISKSIRAAKMVVAVCSPRCAANESSPNVMYELGLAHSLGKPTVILTTDPDTLPADIRPMEALKYDPEEIDKKFVTTIKDKMRDVISRMSAPYLIDPEWDDILVASARHRMLLQPDFWENLRMLLFFGKVVHHELQALKPLLDSVKRGIEKVVDAEAVKWQQKVDAKQAWENFYLYYLNTTKVNLFDPLPKKLEEAGRSFNYLRTPASDNNTEMFNTQITDAEKYYDNIKKKLQEYPGIYNRIASNIGDNFIPSLESNSKSLYSQADHLSSVTNNILVDADSLMRSLIGMIL